MSWADVNLTELQKTLDKQGVELVDNQKESVVGRKALAEKTKGPTSSLTTRLVNTSAEFKKIPDEEKLEAFKGLLKGMHSQIHRRLILQLTWISPAYQAEIDNLNKRSKASDNAFLHIYKVLAEVPDPYPLLEAAVVCLIFL
jgi:homeobox protein cut-like